MDRVLDRLWLGAASDLGSTPLKSLGFSGVVDLRDRVSGAASRGPNEDLGVEVHRLNNRDGDPWPVAEVQMTLEFIHSRIASGRILIACGAGMSRSACIAIGYLTRCGWDETSAHAAVKKARPQITPSAAMLSSVLEAIGEPKKPTPIRSVPPLRPEAA